MAWGSDILAALSIRLTTDASKLNDGLKSVKGPLDSMKKNFIQLGGMIAGALGIGATAAGAFKQAINSTGDVQNQFIRLQTQAKEATHQFFKIIQEGDWSNLIDRMRDAITAGGEYADMLDRLEDLNRSRNVQESEARRKLAELNIAYKNQNSTIAERTRAAQEYIGIEKDLADKRLKYANEHLYGKGGLLDELETISKINREKIVGFVREFENYDEIIRIGKEYNELIIKRKNLEREIAAAISDPFAAIALPLKKEELAEVNAELAKLGPLGKAFSQTAKQFGSLTEEQLDSVKNALMEVGEADAAYYENTIKAQTILNSLLKKGNKELASRVDLVKLTPPDKIMGMSFDLPEYDHSGLDEMARTEEIMLNKMLATRKSYVDAAAGYYDKLAERTGAANQIIEAGIEDMIISMAEALGSLAGGAKDVDIGAAFLEPMANMISTLGKMLIMTGVGIEAFNKSLTSLQGVGVIIAGVALVALASAVKAGITNIPSGGGGTIPTPSAGGGDTTSYLNRQMGDRNPVVHFEGVLSGDSIRLIQQRASDTHNIIT